MEGFIVLVDLIWSILCIILFFKLWSACNNVKRLADKYANEKENISKQGRTTLETREDIDKWLKEE